MTTLQRKNFTPEKRFSILQEGNGKDTQRHYVNIKLHLLCMYDGRINIYRKALLN